MKLENFERAKLLVEQINRDKRRLETLEEFKNPVVTVREEYTSGGLCFAANDEHPMGYASKAYIEKIKAIYISQIERLTKELEEL